MGVQVEERWQRKRGEIQSLLSGERLWLEKRYWFL